MKTIKTFLILSSFLILSFHTPSLLAMEFFVGVTTQVPINVGLQLKAKHESGFYGNALLGVVPEPYVNLANNLATGLGLYSDQDAQIISDLLPQSRYLALGLGYEGIYLEGIYVQFNYVKIQASAQTTGRTFLETLLGRSIPATGNGNNIDLEGEVTAWMLTLGHVFPIDENWHILADLSLAKPMSSTSDLTLAGNFPNLERLLNEELDSYLNDLWDDVWIGAIGASALYKF
jgi:hypothetical protein